MSINVTVNGNPISIRRGKMVLSDLENIKKCEREHRKRLRLEQVQEQSRAISKTLLERARQAKKDELDRLEHDDNTEMKRAHDKRLMEFHRRYQDIENIGYAHKNAVMQPDVESIRLEEERRNKAIAKARGTEAVQRLQESKKVVSPNSKQQDRLRKVRELENERSCLVSQLPKKSCTTNIERVESSENGSGSKTHPSTSTRRRVKCVVSKKSPIRKSSKHVKAHSTHTKTHPRVSVSVVDDDNDLDRTLTEENACTDASKKVSSSKLLNDPKKVSDIFEQANRSVCESDENEPRKTVPVTSSIPKKPGRHGAEHYQDSSSDLTSTTSSSSISDDSSYFSDNPTPVNKTVVHHPSPASSKVSMYDHQTRQRKEYERPPGLVERINIRNVPNAEDLAQEIIELESKESAALASQKDQSRKRTHDAILREKIRRDYQALLKNLDLLSKEERKLKANQVACDRQVTAPSKTSENLARRQKKMDRAFESILRNSRDAAASETPAERPITITPRDYIHSNPTPANEWREPPHIDDERGSEASCSEEDGDYSRKRKISELLIKIEQLKRKLLQEYGPDLPDDVFNASVKSLFDRSATPSTTSRAAACRPQPQQQAPPPQIQVINMSSDENFKLASKIVASQCKKFISRPPPPKPTPVAKTSSGTMTTRDQEIQVEMERDKPKEKAPHPIDPLVKIVTPENVDSSASVCSGNSSSTDVVIDVSKKEVTLVPKNSKKSNVKISRTGSSVVSAKSSKSARRTTTGNKTPVKITFEQKKGAAIEVEIDPAKKEITVLPKKKTKPGTTPCRKESPIISGHARSLPGSRLASPSKKLSKSAPPSRHSSPKKPQAPASSRQAKSFEEHRYREQFTQVSIDSSTSINSSSSSTTTNRSFYSRYVSARRVTTRLQDTSDASTIYISPPTAIPSAVAEDANDTRAAILELLNMDVSELRRRAQEVSPGSSPEANAPRSVSRNLIKFMSLVHAQTDTRTRTTQASAARRSTTERTTCNCRDPGCRLFHEKIEDVDRYTLEHCPEILRKYESLQQDCTERIASLTDLIEKVRSEQRGNDFASSTVISRGVNSVRGVNLAGVDLSIGGGTSNGESNAAAATTRTTTMPSAGGSSTAKSVNVNQLVKNMESLHAQLRQTLLVSEKIISQKALESSECPAPAVPAREKSPSLDWSKDTLTNDSLEVSAERAKAVAAAAQQPPQQQQPPSEKSKPRVLNSERVNIRLDRFRVSQGGGAQANDEATSAQQRHQQNEDVVEQLSKEILEQSKSINKSVPPVDKSKDSDDDPLKSSQAPVKNDDESSENAPTPASVAVAVGSSENDEDERSDSLEMSNPEYVPLLAGIPKMSRKNSSSTGGRTRPPVTLISGPYRPEMVSPVHELSTIVEFDTPDTVNKSQMSTRSPSNKCRKRLLPTGEVVASGPSTPTKKAEVKLNKNKPSVHVAPLPPHRSPQSLNTSNKSTSKSIEKSPRKSMESPLLEKKRLSTDGPKKCESSDSLHTLPDVLIEELQQSQDNGDGNYLRVSQISELHSIPDDEIDNMMISEVFEEAKSASPLRKDSADDGQESDKGQLSSTSSRSLSNVSGVSEITTTPSSDLNRLKCPTSPEDLEEGLKKLGLNWALATLKKTREASALGSSSSSDVTPVNAAAARLVSPLKKSHHESTVHDLPEVSDVSSISIKHANKSTDKSVLVKGRTSTPNRMLEQNSDTNSSGTISTLDSFSSDAIQVAHDQSAEHSIPNISFK